MRDQAEKLRAKLSQMSQSSVEETRETKIITVSSGKGGVGKSNFSLNFALNLMEQDKKVMVFDLDLGLANIDVLLGLPPKRTMMHMIERNLSIDDIVEEGPMGLKFVAGGSGFNHLFQMDDRKLTKLFDELSTLKGKLDYIILDTGAGLSNESLRFILAADEIVIVTTPEPTAITDAYAVLKTIHYKDQHATIQVVINRCISDSEGETTAEKLQLVAQQFLKKEIGVLGYLKEDTNVLKAVKKQTPFVLEYPNTVASQGMNSITQNYLKIPPSNKGGFTGFLKRVFHPGSH